MSLSDEAPRSRVRRYIPLIGFVLPTVIIGYGIVIPRSCIAGVNELTIGFGTTVFGAVITYIAGQRMMLPKSSCTKPPLRIRIARRINRQASSPSGWFGRLLGQVWRREHDALNAEVLDELDIREGHAVLEVGSGPGEALAAAVHRASGGDVVGVDAVLAKLADALRPRGKLVLAFRPASDDIPERFRDPTYGFPHVAQLEASLRRVGLTIDRTANAETSPAVLLLTASKP